jgi:hypothetical protein
VRGAAQLPADAGVDDERRARLAEDLAQHLLREAAAAFVGGGMVERGGVEW